jgi:hypothetical protein
MIHRPWSTSSTRYDLHPLAATERSELTYTKVLSETDILRAVEGKHFMNLLCDLSSSASVFPRCYQLEGVQCDESKSEGEGGSAIVYKGKYDGKVVCVKVLKTAPNVKTLKVSTYPLFHSL